MNYNDPSRQSGLAQLSHPKYRADIDGLRAIAVLAVVGFHAFPSSVPGGFVGVDIFFVISGFLISTIIFDSLDRNSFSFAEFYYRRIKRIFPALLLILFACWAFSEFALLPDEYSQLGKHIAGGAGFVSNFFFWRESGYFDELAITKPLLHLWSLSVEEQFYLIWPLLVWATWKKNSVLAVILGITAASFALNIYGIRYTNPGPFFFPQTRFWELMIGALLAYAALYGKTGFAFRKRPGDEKIKAALANLLSLSGAGLTLASFMLITKDARFPGWWALLPTSGAALLIVAGPRAWLNRVILSHSALVWIGLISFPLYLWHWPLLSFAQIQLGGTPPFSIRLSAIVVSIILAWLTYRLVERPIRFGGFNTAKTALSLVLMMSLMAGGGCFAYVHGPFIFDIKDRENIESEFKLKRFPPSPLMRTAMDSYGHECNFQDIAKILAGNPSPPPRQAIDKSCFERDPSKPKAVFLWGSSYAQMLRYGLQKQLPADWQLLQVATSACLPNFQDNDSPGCAHSNKFAIDTIKALKPDVVLVASNSNYDADESKMISDTFKSYGVGKVVFTGPPVPWTTALPTIVARQLRLIKSERTFIGVDKKTMENYAALKESYRAKNLIYVDLTEAFCNAEGCLTRIGEDRKAGMVSFDSAHLMPTGSEYLAKNGLVAAIIGDGR